MSQTSPSPPATPLRVLIAGGGVAGLETAFALRALAADRVTVRILAPAQDFVYRPLAVGEPFTAARARRYRLAGLAAEAGAELLRGAMTEVDVAQRVVRTDGGDAHAYDALVVCPGAVKRHPFAHTTRFDDAHSDELLHGLVQDIEEGYVSSLAIIVPAPPPWPLPAYELALMASERAWDMRAQMETTVLTTEPSPLAVFGPGASHQLSRLLSGRGVRVIPSSFCEVPEAGTIVVHPGGREVRADRILSLPALLGPALAGLPQDGNGFIPVDDRGRVAHVERVWAAGDATDYPVKHGGVAAALGDTVAAEIARLAGARVDPEPFAPRLEGVLLTGGRALRVAGVDSDGTGSALTEVPAGERPAKIPARHLAPHLTEAMTVTEQRATT